MRLLRPAFIALSVSLAASPAWAASPSDIGSWGDAWGDDTVAAPTRPAPRQQQPPVAKPVVAAPTTPIKTTSPAALGGWGDAWADSSANAAPSPLPTAVQPPTTSPPPPPQPTASVVPPVAVAADNRLAVTAQKPGSDDQGTEPVELTADQIIHDRELAIVTAKGRVEIVEKTQTLVADTVSYNLKQDIISASGNVVITQPNGEVAFADYFELTGDFKDGVAKEIKVILADSSRLSATDGKRVGGNRTDFSDGIYTACEPCRRHPERRPLWEVKAKQITHNQQEAEIEYRDAWVEFAGVPIMYTPYMAHPDPSVRRSSGFLTPSPSQSSTLGTSVTTPYFWAIADNQDLTFSPRFLFPKSSTTNTSDLKSGRSVLQRMVLAGEHRWQGLEGETRTKASLTADKYSADLRGHIDAEGRFDLSKVWRAGYQVQRSSDDTYTSIYGYSFQRNQPWLTSRPYLEGFGRRNYALIEGYAYQGLREDDDPGTSPLVLPHASYSHISLPSTHGGYWTLDADTLNYARSEGLAANRLSSTIAWHRPFMGRMGDITDLTASLRGDAYHADHLDDGQGSANSGRAIPQVAMNWRQPFVRPGTSLSQVVEPLLMVAASPNGNNSSKIPNEDSLNFELDENNALLADRMTGLDRVEGGLRGGYGLRWAAYPRRGGFVTAQVAQGWRAQKDSTYTTGQGFDNYLSDYVARLDFSPTGNIAILNRVRLDKDNLSLRRNENTLSIGSPLLRFETTYVMLEKSEGFSRRHALVNSISSELSQYWSVLAQVNTDLLNGGDIQRWSAKATYSDECFAFVTDLRRTLTYDRDDAAGYELTFNIVFKTLGDVPVNVF